MITRANQVNLIQEILKGGPRLLAAYNNASLHNLICDGCTYCTAQKEYIHKKKAYKQLVNREYISYTDHYIESMLATKAKLEFKLAKEKYTKAKIELTRAK